MLVMFQQFVKIFSLISNLVNKQKDLIKNKVDHFFLRENILIKPESVTLAPKIGFVPKRQLEKCFWINKRISI